MTNNIPHPKGPERLVQTHLTVEARASLQQLADEENDGSVSAWVRSLIMKELWEQRRKLIRRGKELIPDAKLAPTKTVETRIRIEFHTDIGKDVCDNMQALATLDGDNVTEWLRGVILRELHRNRKRLAAVARLNTQTNGAQKTR